MATLTLTVRDETAAGRPTGQTVVEFLTDRVTVRELIRSRVYQEVDDYNRRRPDAYRGLVDPTDAERTLNGVRPKAGRDIDWRAQFDQACAAFDRNGFFVLVDDRQVESLDDELTLRPDTAVSFVKLMPLVGG